MSRSARNALAEDFAKTLAADFAQHGVEAIATLRANKLDVYLRLVAAMEPNTDPNQTSRLESLSDEELSTAMEMVRAAIAEKSSPCPSPLEGEGGARQRDG